jgi:hypothetical protein
LSAICLTACAAITLFAQTPGKTVIRLSGNVAAEKFLNIVTPPLAGNRRAMAPRNLGSGPASIPSSALGGTATGSNAISAGNRFSLTVLKPLSANTNVTSGISARRRHGLDGRRSFHHRWT